MRKPLVFAVSLAFLAAAAIGAFAGGSQESNSGPALTQAPANFDDLVKAAQKEGQLTVIALPRNWLNYGEAIDTFAKKYGIKVNELNPDGDRRRAASHPGEQGQQGPPGSGRHRRRLLFRARREERRSSCSVQSEDVVHDPRQRERC